MEYNCLTCCQCNRKGKPSVMKGSSYCDAHNINNKIIKRIGIFQAIKNRLFEKRFNERTGDMKQKGFRKSWFMR